MNELKAKPGKHLSLFSKVSAFIFFLVNYELRFIWGIISNNVTLPSIDEVLGLIYASAFLGSIFIAVDLSIIVQNIKGTRE